MSVTRRSSTSTRAFCAIVVSGGLLISACGGGSDDAPTSVAAPTAGCSTESTSGRDGVTPIPISPPSVTVTDAGGPDRKLAAGAPDRDSPQQVRLLTTSSEASATSTTTTTVETPITAQFHCTDSTDLEMTLGTPTSPVATLADELKASAGTRAGMALGPGLVPISLRLIPTDSSSSEARSSIEQSLVQALQTSIALPTEPIGVGATWRTERTISAAATVVQTISARLTRWEGNRVTIAFTSEDAPVNSVFVIPGGDATLTINRYSYTGSGEVTLDLTRGLPVAGEARYTGARELAGAEQTLLQQIGLTVTWR